MTAERSSSARAQPPACARPRPSPAPGTGDLRADRDLPRILAVSGLQTDPRLAHTIDILSAWRIDGSHRIDRTHFRPMGATGVALMPWANRPTCQQAAEIPEDR